jgi:hypothetical protein
MRLENNFAGQRPRFQRTGSLFLLILWIFFLQSGCAMWPEPTRSVHVGATGPIGSCADFFTLLDRQVTASDAIDAGYARVEHYPYLRTDRFIASFEDEVEDNRTFATWVDHMQALDQSARRFEIAGLSESNVAALASMKTRDELYDKVVACGNLLKNKDFTNSENKARLRRRAAVRDEYIPLRRVLGISPISDIFVLRGVDRWHAEARARFSPEPPSNWHAIRYAPVEKPDFLSDPLWLHRIMNRTKRDALGIPAYPEEDRRLLFQAHAPLWEVPAQGDFDRIGTPIWTEDGRIEVDTGSPQTYTRLSFTRFGKAILTQLNYVVWFPSRPKEGVMDIYGGLLDGLNYRVTLDTDGKPILYETMHNCGCYYKAYPTSRLQVRKTMAYSEPPLIFNAREIDVSREWMVVAMAPRTHYVNHLYPLPRDFQSNTVDYRLQEYDHLKSLPQTNGNRKSMFNRYGIVPGSERLERYILWPTGVLSPGAMRQWGKHAVAFVGQRHFDDPFYLDRMFRPNHIP